MEDIIFIIIWTLLLGLITGLGCGFKYGYYKRQQKIVVKGDN